MTGMERNSDIVKLASYAPLFVHTENRGWPTNLIVFDNHRLAASPDAYPPSMIAFDNHRCACLGNPICSAFRSFVSMKTVLIKLCKYLYSLCYAWQWNIADSALMMA